MKVKSAEVEQLRLIANCNAAQKVDANELDELRVTVQRPAKYEALLERIDADFLALKFLRRASRLGKRASAWEEVALDYDPGIETKLRAGERQ